MSNWHEMVYGTQKDLITRCPSLCCRIFSEIQWRSGRRLMVHCGNVIDKRVEQYCSSLHLLSLSSNVMQKLGGKSCRSDIGVTTIGWLTSLKGFPIGGANADRKKPSKCIVPQELPSGLGLSGSSYYCLVQKHPKWQKFTFACVSCCWALAYHMWQYLFRILGKTL